MTDSTRMVAPTTPDHGTLLPEPPVARWTRPIVRFLEIEAAGGAVLLACTAVALAVMNSPWAGAYAAFWATPVGLSVGGWELRDTLGHWVNDALMAVFFFVVGLEVKREVVVGELRDPRKAALPLAAAAGGMVVPAALYLAFQWGQPGARGWGVPMATDIAFVVGFLALLRRRVPLGLKVFLLSLAVADDIGAVLVIAVFYSTDLSAAALGAAAAGLGLIYLLNRAGVRAVPVYVVAGAGVWLAVYKSGVHPTVAGVLLGFLTPASAWVGDATLLQVLRAAVARLSRPGGDGPPGEKSRALDEVAVATRESASPLHRLELALHPWVGFVVMPLFALANAGVVVDPAVLTSPVAIAVAAGLCVGKPVGVLLFAWAAVRTGVARLPDGVSWGAIAGGGFLAGIGFTMSLFVAALALHGELLDQGKAGTLAGSAVSAAVGVVVLLVTLRRGPTPPKDAAVLDATPGGAPGERDRVEANERSTR